MNEPGIELLIDKLTLQVKSLQEGFELLTRVRDLNELGRKYCLILRGNLFTTNVNLFYKEKDSSHWKPLSVYSDDAQANTDLLEDDVSLNIKSLGQGDFKVAAVLPLIDNSSLGLLVGEKFDSTEYTSIDIIMLQIYMQLLDNAYQSFLNQKKEKELSFELNNRVLQLNSLIDTGIEISKLQNSETLLELALARAVSLTNASAGCLEITSGNSGDTNIVFPPVHDIKKVVGSGNKISSEFTYADVFYRFTLADKESRDGVIPFDTTDEILLDAFARQVYAALENEFLLKEAVEKENIERELSVAASIQQRIIPETLPQIEGYDIAGINIPSKEVGGDYYDTIKLNDGRYALIMADVAGKGVPASLLVSTLNASLSAYLDMNTALDDMAVKINTVIYQASTSDKFITFFMAILNPETGELDIVNAGHNPMLLLRKNGDLVKLEAGGVAFGMFDMGLPFETTGDKMEPGDRLLLYTDGIPEAMTIEDEEYSDERLEEFYKNNLTDTAKKFIDLIVQDVKEFTGDAPQSDDITALYLIRKG
jgi:sigma-B regulation protein RsbU (phosphoserine phosphatase)